MEQLNFRQLWDILRKRWIMVLALPLLAAIAVLTLGRISSYISEPVPMYSAVATLIVERKAPETALPTGQVVDNSVLQQPIKNYIELSKSRSVKTKVIKDLNLALTVEELDKMIYVVQVNNSDLLKVQVINKDAALGAAVVNATADELSKVVTVDRISVVDRAEAQTTPEPQGGTKKVYVVFAFILGLMASFSLVFLLESLDNTVKTSRDVKDLLGIPLLGVIANYKKGKQGKHITAHSLIALEQTKSPILESYRWIRTNLESASPEQGPQSIVITSSGPHEGRSGTAANLAVSMAQSGKSVLVLDADLHNPNQHKLFKLDNTQGLSNALVEEQDYRDYIRETTVLGLSVLTAGPIPHNPADLLGSVRMKRLIEAASKQFDRIIIDTPPVIAFSDAAILAQNADGVILVLASGEVNKDYARTAKEQLENVGAKILGVVLNKVEIVTREYNHYYNYMDAEVALKQKKHQ